jgi:outer membrane protein OmpU
MKKVLYGTTALVAAGLAAGQADAASGLKLGITGFYRGAGGTVIGGEGSLGPVFTGAGGKAPSALAFGDYGRTGGGFRQEIRLNFTGETTLDNGLTVGVLVGINGENLINVNSKTTPQKRSYVDFKGKFGDFRFGEYESADTTDCVGDPGNVTANFGVNSPNESFANGGRGYKQFSGTAGRLPVANGTVGVAPFGSIGTCFGIESRGTKIGYFSPTFGGFTFGVTYTPSGTTRNPGGGYFYGTDLKPGLHNILGVGADYNADFGGGVTLTVGGGGEWALESNSAYGGTRGDKPATYLLGFQVGLPGGFAVGASGEFQRNYKFAGYAATDAFPGDNGWIATAGGSYTVDAVSIGLQGMYSKWEVFGNTGNDKIWGVSLNGAYALGPGINLEAQLAYHKYNSAFGGFGTTGGYSSPASYKAIEIDGGFAVNF